jgi:threonine dehydrogenase-like Zn-dependent dehydrogenase
VVPESTRAVVLHEYGGPPTVEEVPVPQELENNAILVKTRAATLCGSDVHIWQGQMAAVLDADLPIILGHEMTGEIVAFGPGHRRDSIGQSLSVGDRIVWTQSSCYSCYACTMLHSPAKCENRQYYGLTNCTRYPNLLGGLAQHCYVLPGSGRVRVPDAIPDHWASGSSCALRTVVSSFERLTRPLDAFQTVVIQGAGPLGLFATALARWMGVERVITIGGPQARLDVATAWGAEQTLLIDAASTSESRVAAILELTSGHGADVVMELSGGRTAFAEGLQMVRNSGDYIVTGPTTGTVEEIQPSTITRKNVNVLGSWSADASHYWKALEFMERARAQVPFEDLFSNEYDLDHAHVALTRMGSFEETKPVIYPWGKAD